MIFFSTVNQQNPVLDCVWSVPCLQQPDLWYRRPPVVAVDRDPVRYPSVRMRVLGDLSKARAVAIASQQHNGNCAIFVHDACKRAEQAFYEGLESNVVCQYVPLTGADSVVAIGVVGSLVFDKHLSTRIALSIDGPNPRSFISGSHIPPRQRETFELVEQRCPPRRRITRIAVDDSWLEGSTSGLRIAAWWSKAERECASRAIDSPFPAVQPSHGLRISAGSGKALWSTVTVGPSDTFIPYLHSSGDVTLCLGLLIQKGRWEEVLGQWRPEPHTWRVAMSCAMYRFRRVVIKKQPQVQLIAVESLADGAIAPTVPIAGDLQWLTDGMGSDVMATGEQAE